MKKIKVLALFLATIMAMSAFTACSSSSDDTTSDSSSSSSSSSDSSSSDDTATDDTESGEIDLSETMYYTGMAQFRPQHTDFAEMPFVIDTTAAANIEITWQLVPDSTQDEVTALALATGDVADVTFGLVDTSELIANSSLFLPLNEYSDYTPLTNEILANDAETLSYMTVTDGNYYALPHIQEKEYEGKYCDLFVNQDWLDYLGLDVPTTIDEFEAMLVAFKTGDPNQNGDADEIPYSFIINHMYFGLDEFYGVFGSIDQVNRLYIEDGEIYFTADKTEWQDATAWFASLYSQGLIDVEGFTQDRTTFFAKGSTDTVTIGSLNGFLLDNVVGSSNSEQYTFIEPLVAADGSGEQVSIFKTTPIASRTNGLVSAKCENPERLIYWMDTLLTEENSIQSTFGLFGKQLLESDEDSEYEYYFAVAPDDLSQDDYRFQDAPANFPTYLTSELYNTLEPAVDVAEKLTYMELTEDYFTDEWIPDVIFTDDEADELASIQTALQDYVLQMQAAFITGTADVYADWDTYVATCTSLGSERYVEIYQAAYDRYYGLD